MKGRCVICKEEESEVLCRGCDLRPGFLCFTHARPCRWCGDEGPYCPECTRCAASSQCGGYPGKWKCAGCTRAITPGSFRKQCECDKCEWRCSNCMRECECGEGETHYVCGREWHLCNAEKCFKPVCDKYGKLELAFGAALLCGEHRRAAKKRQVELGKKDDV